MGYMKKRSAEAMGWSSVGGFWDFLSIFKNPPADAAAPAPAAPVVTAPSGPPAAGCGPGLVYEVFYDSCVTPCPPGQTYNHSNGICESAGMSNTTMLAIGVGVVAGYLLLTKKKRGRR